MGDAHGGVFEGAAEPSLALAQRLLGMPVIGDIDATADEPNRSTRRVAHGHAAREHPAIRPILTPDAMLDLELTGLAGQVILDGTVEPLPVIGMNQVEHGLEAGRDLGPLEAQLLPDVGEIRPAVVNLTAGHIELPDADIRTPHRQLEAGVGQPERILDPLAPEISRSSSRGLRMASATGVTGTKAMTVLTDAMAVASLIRPASR